MSNIFNRLIIVLAIIFSAFSCNQPTQKANNKTSGKKEKKLVSIPNFNADSAYYFVEKQVSFGPRVSGTKAQLECANYLKQKLTEYCDTVYIQNFKARTYDNVTRNGINLIGSLNPNEKNRILLMSHWDSRPFADHDPDISKRNTPIDAANDGASGVGILLEMARQFHIQHPEVGVDIVLFDLEDWGPPNDLNLNGEEYWGLGSQYWAKNPHLLGYNATFGVLLDMVGASNPTFQKEYFSKYYARYYVDLVWDKAKMLGYDNVFINQEGGAINDDHVFVNKYAKIPSIDIIDLDQSSVNGSFFDQWHTTGDNMEQIDKQSLKIVGEVLLNVVYYE
jgi:Zn-dependent M28 family amino/carboxypeptidase